MKDVEARYVEFVGKLTDHKVGNIDLNILHMVLGLIGEAGEIADEIKHVVGYNQPLNEKHLKEEMGDTLFYFVRLANHFDWSLQELMLDNMTKLMKEKWL